MLEERTDRNNNPAAFTTDIAAQAGLSLNVDYIFGDTFPNSKLFTAKLLGDPVTITIRVIDSIGYYTKTGGTRWTYIAIPTFIWNLMSFEEKRDVIGFHYQNEGGITMRSLFPNYGKR